MLVHHKYNHVRDGKETPCFFENCSTKSKSYAYLKNHFSIHRKQNTPNYDHNRIISTDSKE
jgi:hypothetical protein